MIKPKGSHKNSAECWLVMNLINNTVCVCTITLYVYKFQIQQSKNRNKIQQNKGGRLQTTTAILTHTKSVNNTVTCKV